MALCKIQVRIQIIEFFYENGHSVKNVFGGYVIIINKIIVFEVTKIYELLHEKVLHTQRVTVYCQHNSPSTSTIK